MLFIAILLVSQCTQIWRLALFAASTNGHGEVVRALIAGGAHVNKADKVWYLLERFFLPLKIDKHMYKNPTKS